MKVKILPLLLCFFLFYLVSHLAGVFNGLKNDLNVLHLLENIVQDYLSRSFWVFLMDTVLTYLLFYYLYPRQGTIVTVLVYLLLAVPLMIGLRFLIEEVILFYITGYHNYNMRFLTTRIYILDNLYFTIYYNFVAIAFFGVQYERYSKLKRQELELQARKAELSFLKSQVNPHFLFNNLNNIYALVYQQSPNSLPAISKLSELLRYMLYQKEDEVLLSQEIKYLHNFIDLQLLRYDFDPQLKIRIPEDIGKDLKIVPLSLIPFVENAFKHGDLRDSLEPLHIHLEVKGAWLFLEVSNKKNMQRKDGTGGIGLENVRKRLELLKFGKYTLEIIENEHTFSVKLNMMIHE